MNENGTKEIRLWRRYYEHYFGVKEVSCREKCEQRRC